MYLKVGVAVGVGVAVLVGVAVGEVDDTVGNYNIHIPVRNRQMLYLTKTELNIAV